MIVSVPFYGIAWSNEFDEGKGSKSDRGFGPEVWVGRWDSWKTSMTRVWPVVVLENIGAIERTPKTWIAGPGACRNNIHKGAHMLKSTCNPRQETQETQETRILHGENDDDWITESVLWFLCIWGHGHSWRLRFQRKNRRQLIISQTTGTKIQNLSSFALTLDSFNSFTFQIVSGFSNPQGSLAYFQRRNSWNVFWRLLHFCSSQLSKSTTKIDQVTCPDTASLTLLMNFGSRRFSKQTFS